MCCRAHFLRWSSDGTRWSWFYIFIIMKKARQNEWLFCARENYVDIGMAVRCDNSWHQRKKEGMEKMEFIYSFAKCSHNNSCIRSSISNWNRRMKRGICTPLNYTSKLKYLNQSFATDEPVFDLFILSSFFVNSLDATNEFIFIEHWTSSVRAGKHSYSQQSIW